jgi:SAM-dependent methyltransferase
MRPDLPRGAGSDESLHSDGGPGALARAGANPRLRRLTGKDGVLPAWMEPLSEPRWLSPAQAGGRMRAEDPVLGLEFAGRAWALPWWQMKNHHVANLTLDGRPVLVTLCEICSSAAAFDPVIDGRRHAFRLAGVYGGTIMPTDVETGTLWTGFTGTAVEGPLLGRVMRRLPLRQSTWGEWLELYPESLVPEGEGEARDGHGEGQSPGSPVIGQGMRPLLQHVDLRLPHHVLVLGVQAGGEARCYPLAQLDAAGPVLNDSLGGRDIAVFCRPGSWMALAYGRELEGRRLAFRGERGAILDEQTGSRWELSGTCSDGPLRGARLPYVYSGVEEFFIWASFHPATGIHGLPAARAGVHGAPRPLWSADAVHDPVHRAIAHWWPRGAKLLEIGCGKGLVSAWMAERGLQVYAVDEDARAIAHARRSFRGVVRLAFEVAGLRAPLRLPAGFEAVLDHGYFAQLSEAERGAYAANLAAATAPGARYLLLIPASLEEHPRLRKSIAALFAPGFRVYGLSELSLARPAEGRTVPAASFRLLRR